MSPTFPFRQLRGVLHGLPISIKEQLHMVSFDSTCGACCRLCMVLFSLLLLLRVSTILKVRRARQTTLKILQKMIMIKDVVV